METLTVTLTCLSPLRLTETGVARGGLPATTLKGAIRAQCEQLARAYRLPVCEVHRENSTCTICMMFGTAWREGLIYWSDLHPESPLAPALESHRFAARSRKRGGILSVHTQQDRVFPTGTILKGTIRHALPDPQQIDLLRAALTHLSHIGARTLAGYGACQITVSAGRE
jgi:hypothetical protein